MWVKYVLLENLLKIICFEWNILAMYLCFKKPSHAIFIYSRQKHEININVTV